MGHRHRRLRRARQHLRGQPRPARRGDRRRATGRSRSPAGCATWSPPPTRRRGATPRCAQRFVDDARLPGGPVRARSARTGRWCCGTRSGSTPATRRARDRWRAGRATAYRDARDAHVRAVRRGRRPARVQLHGRRPRAAPAPTATRRWPGWPAVLLVVAAGRRCVLGTRAGCSGSCGARRARRPAGAAGWARPGRGGSATVPAPATARRPGARVGAAGGRRWCSAARCSPGSPRPRTWSSTLGAWLLFAVRAAAAAAAARPVPPVGGARRRRPAAHA